jgi:hypothetical protein
MRVMFRVKLWATLNAMESAADLERKLLGLPAAERERLALTAWESLANDPVAAADRRVDPEGIRLAEDRDSEIESAHIEALDEEEFHRRTGGV